MVTFLKLSTFKFFRKAGPGGDGATDEITNPIWVRFMKKYHALVDSQQSSIDEEIEEVTGDTAGIIENALSYSQTVTDVQEAHDSNPIMLTVEELEEDPIGAPGVKTDHLIGYSLDFKVVGTEDVPITFGNGDAEFALNPDITEAEITEGNNLIHQLDGGRIDDADVGLEWEELITDGDVLAPDGEQIVDLPPAINLYPSTIQSPPEFPEFIDLGDIIDDIKTVPMPFLLFNQADIA